MADILQMVLAVFLVMAMATAVPLSQDERVHPDHWLIGWPRGPHYFAGVAKSGRHVHNGDPVLLDAPKWGYTTWVINNEAETTSVQLLGGSRRPKCLDAGLSPGNGTPLKIWDCYPGLFQQTWVRREGKVRLSGTNLCLDVRDGNPQSGLQLWECIEGDHDNQLLILEWPENYP